MTRPTREAVDGRAFLDLRARANADGRPVDEYLTLYALEGFLERLSRSAHRDRFVLKGGVLLAAFNERRPIRDVDLDGLDLDNAVETVKKAIVEIASIETDDGPDDQLVASTRLVADYWQAAPTASRRKRPPVRHRWSWLADSVTPYGVAPPHPFLRSVSLGCPGWTASMMTRRLGFGPRPFRCGSW